MRRTYTVLVSIDDDIRIVNVYAYATHLPGKSLSFETAWAVEPFSPEFDIEQVTGWIVYRPTDGHQISTYDNRDQAIVEAMTSLRDNIDNDERYR